MAFSLQSGTIELIRSPPANPPSLPTLHPPEGRRRTPRREGAHSRTHPDIVYEPHQCAICPVSAWRAKTTAVYQDAAIGFPPHLQRAPPLPLPCSPEGKPVRWRFGELPRPETQGRHPNLYCSCPLTVSRSQTLAEEACGMTSVRRHGACDDHLVQSTSHRRT